MRYRAATFYIAMPRLGKVRAMETFEDGMPKPVTDEQLALYPLLVASSRRVRKEHAELERLTTLYALLCEEYSNGQDSRFAQFMDKLTEIPR